MKTLATLLTQEQVQRTHKASLEVLSEVGMIVRNDKALAIFVKNGCEVDSETLLVKFPASIVEHFRKMMPPTFTFRGRDPQFDRTIPDDSPVIITASSTPDIIDPVTGEKRRSTSDDIARIAHLINELPGYDVFSISTLADDAPPDQFTISRLYPALKNCLKPIRSTATDIEDVKKVLRLGSLIAGSDEAYRERPFITHHFCPVVSPLTFDHDSTEMLIYFVEQGLPVYPSIVPNGGLTSPMTLAGTLVQGNAEFLAAAVLMQMIRPNTPLIYSTLPTMADLRTGAYASGGIECGMLQMACAQMSHYYDVPSGGYIGLTNSKINDAQSGYETGLSTMGGLLAGADMFNMGGLLDALMAFDFAKAVIDDEIAQMLKRVKRGFEFSDKKLALDVIAKVGPGGAFLSNPHTVKFMRTGALLPKIADRNAHGDWVKKGSHNTHDRALLQAREILGRENIALFSPEIEKKIRTEFDNLVAGDLKLPEGW
ncbi:MAG: trimethylamine methyltransferase [Anaerolineae bacterium]|nr:trimethylamine methyltransferase [Anaerolineae bacterium]MBT4310144.1 trimethylamine methyltransferase [Anaerolineae bacterium]MBT4457918.1 trimethylamine methyltransferase [Anaerolineae bacterium]MBT4843417.1 trimethylamine methyltransferase [Anaerolineae bacterium]MBT6062510.1 trimethylamine methyltransferase [Anaerolineae bacterium]